MTTVQLLKLQANNAFAEFKDALKGVTEPEAWAVLSSAADDFLNTDGSIQGIVLHVAGCKVMYGSIAFRNAEVRWRDIAERMDQFEPSWQAAHAYLDEAQTYWLESWKDLLDEDLEREVSHFSGKVWPVWKILDTVIRHDSYHAGQLAVIRYATTGSDTPPPSSADDVRQYCQNLPNW
jgi:uncharacterized damage-inducible protein DinB